MISKVITAIYDENGKKTAEIIENPGMGFEYLVRIDLPKNIDFWSEDDCRLFFQCMTYTNCRDCDYFPYLRVLEMIEYIKKNIDFDNMVWKDQKDIAIIFDKCI